MDIASEKAKVLLRRASMAGVDIVADLAKMHFMKKAALATAMAESGLDWHDLGVEDDEMEKTVSDMKKSGLDPQTTLRNRKRRGSLLGSNPNKETDLEMRVGAENLRKQAKLVNPMMAELKSNRLQQMMTRRATMADKHAIVAKGKNVFGI